MKKVACYRGLIAQNVAVAMMNNVLSSLHLEECVMGIHCSYKTKDLRSSMEHPPAMMKFSIDTLSSVGSFSEYALPSLRHLCGCV